MAIRKLQGSNEHNKGSYFEFDTEADVLGEGGMGRVYLGKRVDESGAVSPVAVKAMFEGLPDQVIERAKREASIQLHNDSLVHMYDFIETVDKDMLGTDIVHYHVISEYLDGISLENLILGKLEDRKGNVLPNIAKLYKEYTENREKIATDIIKRILSGVMALHDIGYIHRDIDPTNIMVTSDGKIKLIDFGVAKQLVRLNTADKGLTSSGQFLGKAGYAAPELVLGDVRHQNYSTDVYAIGILYYQLLTGHLPFEGTSYEMMESQLHKKIPLRGIHSHQIKKIIKKATGKKQSDRYSTSAQFRAAIDVIVYPEPWYINKTAMVGIAGTVIAAIVICMIVGKKDDPSPTQEELYGKYLAKLNFNQPDSVTDGLAGMNKLAEDGYIPAMYQVAYTYMWAPNDSLSAQRKTNLGLSVNDMGLLNDKDKTESAITWLKTTIEKSDSMHYQAMYTLASYYLNGIAVEKDIERARHLFEKGKDLAIKGKDDVFVEKFNKGLLYINAYKQDENE